MSLKNNRAPLLCYFKLYASFRSHWWIHTGVTVRKHPFWVKFDDFYSCVTLKFDGWPWKTIGHLLYVASSFVHHFIAIGEFKLKLQSGNSQFGSKSALNFIVPCDLEIWRMTLKSKLCASFHNHWWIKTGVTVRKRPIWVKIDDFFSRMTSKFDAWPWKTIGHLFYATSSFVHHFAASPETPNLGQIRRFFEPCDLEIWWMTLKNNRAPLLATSSFVQHFIIICEFKLE